MSIVLVTGRSSGIGLATAILFARLGHEVHAGVRSTTGATELTAAIEKEKLAIHPVTLESFFSDVRHRCIWYRDVSGEQAVVKKFSTEADGLLGVFALKIDVARNQLWASSSAVPEMQGCTAADRGKAFQSGWAEGNGTGSAREMMDNNLATVADSLSSTKHNVIFVPSSNEDFVSSTWVETAATHAEAPGATEEFQRSQQQTNAGADPESRPEPIRHRGARVGRNDLCPCGSGKKYKNCHMRKGIA